MVEELQKPVEADLQFKEGNSLGESRDTEDIIEPEERTDCEDEKGTGSTDDKVEFVTTKKNTRKRTNHDHEEGIKLRRERDRLRQKLARQNEDEEKRRIRLEKDRMRKRFSRKNEDNFERLKRRDKDRERRAKKREMERRNREEGRKNENVSDVKDENRDNCIIPSVEVKEEDQKTVNKNACESKQIVKNNHPNDNGKELYDSLSKDTTKSEVILSNINLNQKESNQTTSIEEGNI